MNIVSFIVFLSVSLSIYFGLHYYIYLGIVKGLGLSARASLFLRIFLLIAALSFPIGRFLSKRFTVYPLLYFGAIWLGVISIAFTVFILKDIIVLILPHQKRVVTIISIILILIISAYSLYNNSGSPKIKEINIPIEKLPAGLSGFTIVHLSDLHLGRLTPDGWLNSVVDKSNTLDPNLILITGDLIDGNMDITNIDKYCEVLNRLESKYGIFAVTGNHEFYSGVNRFMEFAEKAKITVLRNENISVANNMIEIIGIDDKDIGPDLEKAVKGCDFGKPVILLSHRPEKFEKAVNLGVDLQLSGHTHAGQIPPLDLIVKLVFRYPYGLHKNKSSYIYTTSGTGVWGPPMRLFSKSEIVKFTLK